LAQALVHQKPRMEEEKEIVIVCVAAI